MATECIIFGCDGVLFDSQCLMCKQASDLFKRIGSPVINERLMTNCWDGKYNDAVNDLVKNGSTVSPEEKINTNYEKNLKPVPHIRNVLQELTIPVCIASENSLFTLERRLKRTGLYEYFKGRIFTAEVAVWAKPSTDIYLHIAKKMNINPERFMVIENDVRGIVAAKAAKMQTIGYIGGTDANAVRSLELRDAGAITLFYDMRDLFYISKGNLEKTHQH